MFITKKITKKNIIIAVSITIAVLFVLVRLTFCGSAPMTTATSNIGSYSLEATTNEDRIEFLSQFGWKVDSEPIEISTVTIPEKFNDVYNSYNEIQLEQGLDLHNYEGKECRRVTYRITNYPESEQQVNANLLIYNGYVVGGDISSINLDGFMHGFVLDGFSGEVK